MNFDDLASAWQEQNEHALSPDDREAMIARVCRRVERMSGVVTRRDIGETIAALFVIVCFGWFITRSDNFVAKIGAGICVGWGLFIIYEMYRTRTIERPASLDAPVREFCRIERDRLDRQIQLLRSVLWWYIAPCMIGVNTMFFGLAGWGFVSLAYGIVTLLMAWGIYALNLRAVAKCLVPAREELANLLSQLEDSGPDPSGTGQVRTSPTEQPIAAPSQIRGPLVRGPLSFAVLLATLAAFGVATAVFVGDIEEYPKRAPFTAVRWEDDQPVVKIGGEWFTLVSLDGIAAEDIVAFCRRTDPNKWQKRFSEDLVEVLTRMGHEPKYTVRLVVSPLGSAQTRTLENVWMTRAKRQAVRNANSRTSDQTPRSSSPAGDSLASAASRASDLLPRSGGPAGDSLASLVTDQREEKKLVGLAAMVMVDGQVEAAAAHGERKRGSGVSLEIGDRWHLGGISKSITATMIARLIESGQMQWSDSVDEVFPEASVHDDWKPVTLRQLLTDTAGAPPNFPREVSRQRPAIGAESTQARREAVLGVIAQKPAYPPGEKRVYSNVGYTIAGAMAEKVTGATWEDLMKREVFEPLELTEAGFGPPKSADETLEQPRGHRTVRGRKVSVDDTADNTSIMGPAATIHMTLEKLCIFAWEHLQGELGTDEFLSVETYNRLHTPELDTYACGWLRRGPSAGIPCTIYWHNGSNTMWYALVVFIPDKNMVVAVTSNDGDTDSAEAAAWEIVQASANQFNVEGDAERRQSLLREPFPKKSPFGAVRWQESQREVKVGQESYRLVLRDDFPHVKVGQQWYQLVSIDDLPAAEIVAFSRETYANRWQKRFEEDLVELLSRMGHPPQDTVKLVVQSLTSSETQVLEDILMTEANRQAIKAAANARANSEP